MSLLIAFHKSIHTLAGDQDTHCLSTVTLGSRSLQNDFGIVDVNAPYLLKHNVK